jgi:hypothetical protein
MSRKNQERIIYSLLGLMCLAYLVGTVAMRNHTKFGIAMIILTVVSGATAIFLMMGWRCK